MDSGRQRARRKEWFKRLSSPIWYTKDYKSSHYYWQIMTSEGFTPSSHCFSKQTGIITSPLLTGQSVYNLTPSDKRRLVRQI